MGCGGGAVLIAQALSRPHVGLHFSSMINLHRRQLSGFEKSQFQLCSQILYFISLRPLEAGVPAACIADQGCVHPQPYSEHEAKAAFSRMLSHHKRNGW